MSIFKEYGAFKESSCISLPASFWSFLYLLTMYVMNWQFWINMFKPRSKHFWNITKTRLYNFDPLKPHFYIVKLGFTGVYIILLKNIDCEYSLEPPRRGGSNEYHNLCFENMIISVFFISEAVLTSTHNLCFENMIISVFFVWNFSFFFWL